MAVNIDAASSALEQAIDNEVKKIREANRNAAKRALNKTMEDMIKDFKPGFDKVIYGFYSEYTPDYYPRQNRMYDILQIKSKDIGQDFIHITIGYDGSAIPTRSGGDGLLDTVFGEGYHGGARGEDHNGVTVNTPHYRTPYRMGTNSVGGTYTRLNASFWWWGDEAFQSEPPYQQWLKWLNNYVSDGKVQKIFDSHYKFEKAN